MQTVTHLHLISDATGETLIAASTAALAQFAGRDVQRHVHALVRTAADAEMALEQAIATRGVVFFTLADRSLGRLVQERCRDRGLTCVDVLTPLIDALALAMAQPVNSRPGAQHLTDDSYFRRISALDFSMGHDDGASADRLKRADVVLVGVSRVSKTPTSIYLAWRGIKTANVPLVPGVPPPPTLLELTEDGPLVVGLTLNPTRLAQLRSQRLEYLQEPPSDSSYTDLEAIRNEVAAARELFERQGWPSIDVTRRSVEETAAAIMSMLRRKRPGFQE